MSNNMTHFDLNYILSPFQHGFRSKLCYETQLLSFTTEIFDNWMMENRLWILVKHLKKKVDLIALFVSNCVLPIFTAFLSGILGPAEIHIENRFKTATETYYVMS